MMSTYRSARYVFQSLATLIVFLLALFGAVAADAQQASKEAQGMMAAPGPRGGVKSGTCTSTDGKATCVCGGKKFCFASKKDCGCASSMKSYEKAKKEGATASPNTSAAKSLPMAVRPGTGTFATCTSGDGKKVCPCGEKSCTAGTTWCNCVTYD